MPRIGHRKRWDGKLLFGLYMQRHATGHEHFEQWTGGEEFCYFYGCIDYLLEVVQQQQDLIILQVRFQLVEQWLLFVFFEVKHLGNGGYEKPGITNGGQIHEIQPIREYL